MLLGLETATLLAVGLAATAALGAGMILCTAGVTLMLRRNRRNTPIHRRG